MAATWLIGQDREIDLQAGLGPVRVGEIHRLQADFTPGPHGFGDGFIQRSFLLFFATATVLAATSTRFTKGTRTSSSDSPPCCNVG